MVQLISADPERPELRELPDLRRNPPQREAVERQGVLLLKLGILDARRGI